MRLVVAYFVTVFQYLGATAAESHKNLCQDCQSPALGSNPEAHEYEAGVFTRIPTQQLSILLVGKYVTGFISPHRSIHKRLHCAIPHFKGGQS